MQLMRHFELFAVPGVS